MPGEYKQVTVDFYEANVEKYKKNTEKGIQETAWIEKFSKSLPTDSKVLDAGCGYGRDCQFFSSHNLDSYGIDLSTKMIEAAKEIDPNSKFSVMDLTSLRFESDTFNGIWCNAALLHLSKSDASVALNEFKRVLKTGGVLFLGLKVGEGEKFVTDDRYGNTQRFFSYYSQPEIENLLKTTGFKVVDINYRQNSSESYSRADKICLIAQNQK